ncbi:MAG: phospho-N-acetylmuramoyl-pentapeptide-transferase [Firmicutes bacterium]|nr:phospho-N-acetylmuramoyl-pentapeptide-transferase [Bacillota bacterium]
MIENSKVIYILVINFALGVLLQSMLLPLLRRLKAGQSIREDGPKEHLKKAGTPTMGGIAIILPVVFTGIWLSRVSAAERPSFVWIAIMTLCYGLIGFVDDFIIVVKKNNEGLKPRQKLILQIIVAAVYAWVEYASGHMVYVPFWGKAVSLGIFTVPFLVFVMVAMTNAVNLTDGLDGLSSSVTVAAAAFFALQIFRGKGPQSFASSAMAFAVMGACLAFLCFNWHPAKVFMGDTGSLALGGAMAAIAVSDGLDLFLPIVGGIYVAEALSVIIQVYVFKTQNGRRFFRMAPLHHHFELGGWSEVRVVLTFSVITVLLGIVGALAL